MATHGDASLHAAGCHADHSRHSSRRTPAAARRRRTESASCARADQGIGESGFGGEVKNALQQRADFLEEQGLAQRRGQRVILVRNLLATLRNRDLAQAAQSIAAETGLEHRAVGDGERVSGVYRRNVMLASGRFAMLDDGKGFSLVPWRPVLDYRLGQSVAATIRGTSVSWEFGKQRRLAI